MSTYSPEHRQLDEPTDGHDLIPVADLPAGIQQYYRDGAMVSPIIDGGRVVLQEVKV